MKNNMTDTELLNRINTLKTRHEILKQEIVDHIVSVEEKQNELTKIEEEYVGLISKIVS